MGTSSTEVAAVSARVEHWGHINTLRGIAVIQPVSALRHRRFTTLDGLRGVAAIVVLNFHLGGTVGTWSPRFGYLAVDMFFLLSGFVLAITYQPKFRAGLGLGQFIRFRAVRLGPLYLLGLALGVCVAPFFLAYPIFPSDVLNAIVFGLFGLPALSHYKFSAFSPLFVLNAPLWSLFFEFWVANIAFGVLRKSLNAPFLGIIICLSAIGMLIGETRFYTLSFGQHWISFPYGFSRVGFSFFLGVAIARLRTLHPPQLSVPSWMFLLGLPIVLCLPMQRHLSQIYELVCVFFIFPIMIYFGSEAKEYDSRLGQALGDASYALYVVHWPLLILANYALERTHTPRALQWQLLFTICIVPIAWSLGQIDLKMRSAVMKFVRTKRERGEALGYAGKRDEAQKQFELAAGLDLSAADKAE